MQITSLYSADATSAATIQRSDLEFNGVYSLVDTFYNIVASMDTKRLNVLCGSDIRINSHYVVSRVI